MVCKLYFTKAIQQQKYEIKTVMEMCFHTVLWNHVKMNNCVHLDPFPENLSYFFTTNTVSLSTMASKEA